MLTDKEKQELDAKRARLAKELAALEALTEAEEEEEEEAEEEEKVEEEPPPPPREKRGERAITTASSEDVGTLTDQIRKLRKEQRENGSKLDTLLAGKSRVGWRRRFKAPKGE